MEGLSLDWPAPPRHLHCLSFGQNTHPVNQPKSPSYHLTSSLFLAHAQAHPSLWTSCVQESARSYPSCTFPIPVCRGSHIQCPSTVCSAPSHLTSSYSHHTPTFQPNMACTSCALSQTAVPISDTKITKEIHMPRSRHTNTNNVDNQNRMPPTSSSEMFSDESHLDEPQNVKTKQNKTFLKELPQSLNKRKINSSRSLKIMPKNTQR